MFIKFAKVFALGIGAMITTGVPSGVVPSKPDSEREAYVCRGYRLHNQRQKVYTTAGTSVKVEAIKPAVVVRFGPSEDRTELGKAPEPTRLPLGDVEASAIKPGEPAGEPHKPAAATGIRVILPGYVTPPQRISGSYARYRADTPESFYSGVVTRDPVYYTGGYDGLYSGAAYSHAGSALSSEDRPLKELLSGPAANADAGKHSVVNSGGPGGPENPGDQTTVVPEPTGLIAILAGLPAIAAMTRRRRS